jgi:ADP-heptose:LPS heptosyltransferase
LIQLTPALRALRRKYPEASLSVAVNPKFRDVLLGLPYIDGLVPYPIPVERLKEFDTIIPLEFSVEHNPAANDMTIVDAFAARLGVEVPDSDSKADFILTPEEKAWAIEKYPRDKRRRVMVQATASDACRTYHMERLKQLMGLLLLDEWEVMLIGEPGSIWIGPSDGLYNLTADNLTIRQSAAVLTTCDCAFGPDSMILHLAGALGVPALGVFAAFHWKHRITNHRSVEAIQGHGECSPCHFHAWGGRVWPKDMSCQKAGYCTVLAEIEPSRIATKLARLVRPEIVI